MGYARDEIFTGIQSEGDRPGVDNLILLVTDGGSDEKDLTYRTARQCKQHGIHIITIGTVPDS